MPDLSDVRSRLAEESGLAVVSTVQSGGGVLSSVVNCGLIDHPLSGGPRVAFVSAGSAARLGQIRRGSPVTVTVRRGWAWTSVAGPAQLIGPRDSESEFGAEALRTLLREIFLAAGGAHDDFDEFDRVMVEEARVAVLVEPDRILGNG